MRLPYPSPEHHASHMDHGKANDTSSGRYRQETRRKAVAPTSPLMVIDRNA